VIILLINVSLSFLNQLVPSWVTWLSIILLLPAYALFVSWVRRSDRVLVEKRDEFEGHLCGRCAYPMVGKDFGQACSECGQLFTREDVVMWQEWVPKSTARRQRRDEKA